MDIPLPLVMAKGAAYAQIRNQIQALVSSGKLPPGTRLPPVRVLAQQLKVNRLTVLRAYHELEAMGYLVLEVGCGTFVPDRIPDAFLDAPRRGAPRGGDAGVLPALLRRLGRDDAKAFRISAGWVRTIGANYRFGFESGIGDFRLFPMTTWRRLHLRHLRKADKNIMRYTSPYGLGPLREALRRRILPGRGIEARDEEVMILPGSAYGIHLFLRTILRPGDRVALEEPHFYVAREQILMNGGRPVPVPVDAKGVRIDALRRLFSRRPPTALFVTPSHQLPTTATLDYGRRVQLIEAVSRRPLWVIEDDYDHEFHYDSPPLPSLKSMDGTGQVVYFGSFSKSLFPALRIGFVVGPAEVIRRFQEIRLRMDHSVPTLSQLALADFIDGGHYDVLVRRLRRAYQRRRDLLVDLLRRELPDFAFERPSGGMRLWVRVPKGIDAERVSERLRRQGILLRTGRTAFLTPPREQYLHFGFAAPNESEIREGVKALKAAVTAERRGPR